MENRLIDGLTREQAIIWAAGFIDGEGTIGLKPGRQGTKASLCIQVAQVDPDPLLRLQALWGGSLRSRDARKVGHASYFHWFIWSQGALKCCREILPFLSVKRSQASLAIEFQASRRPGVKTGIAGETDTRTYRSLFAALNQRGIAKEIKIAKVEKAKPPQLRLMEAG